MTESFQIPEGFSSRPHEPHRLGRGGNWRILMDNDVDMGFEAGKSRLPRLGRNCLLSHSSTDHDASRASPVPGFRLGNALVSSLILASA
jgi:hypothetical protein